ncbi:MAG: PQQ-binding-like beta-propeller repeat protein [Pseudomonadales bacterium]|nr:PQQ-binding-like beta-propeller repeat protein [Pseudomonadales bacterium]
MVKFCLVGNVFFCLLLVSVGAQAAECTSVSSTAGISTTGWGLDLRNTRYQPDSQLNANNIADLELAWSFGFDSSNSPHSYPLVSTDTVFVGADNGILYALDKDTGCLRWSFDADGDIRSAIVAGEMEVEGVPRTLLFFGTFGAQVFAVDASNGELVWEQEVDDHAFAMVTGTPAFYEGRLYVPVSAGEVIAAVAPLYGCCTFRGSLVAVDGATGEQIWKRYVIDEEAKVTETRWFFIDVKGPSGAPVWQAPTIDPSRGLIYFATGENYSDPPTDTSDAVFAVNLEDGTVRWHKQFTSGDAWNAACGAGPLSQNCPKANGPDYDFGAPPILARTQLGTDVLLAGQKSGMVFAMNPDSGELLWQTRTGRGGKLGGIHWGMAVNEREGLLYVPVSDRGTGGEHETHDPDPGLHALSLADGSVRWSMARDHLCANREGCFPGVSAAVIATEDMIIAGGLDGQLRAFAGSSGEVLWQDDTWRSFQSVNDVETTGGAIDVHGPLIVGDMMFISSGYASFGQKGGNAFLAYRLKRSR